MVLLTYLLFIFINLTKKRTLNKLNKYFDRDGTLIIDVILFLIHDCTPIFVRILFLESN